MRWGRLVAVTHDTLAVGSLAHLVAEPWLGLDLGPEHPARTGLLLIDVEHADGVIIRADVRPGHSHRAAEKLFEVRDIRQVLSLADRHDWTAAAQGELLVARAAEHLLGLPLPARAGWVRALLAAHARLGSHLAYLSFVPFRVGDAALAAEVHGLREEGRQLLVQLTGNRVHPMVTRLGGVAADPAPDWVVRLLDWAHRARATAGRLEAGIDAAPFAALAAGSGVLTAADVDAYGLGGVIARASGCRRAVAGAEDAGVLTAGDAQARFTLLARDVVETADRLGRLGADPAGPSGPVETRLSKIVKLPDGEVFVDEDAPMGIAGVHLVARGGPVPWRLRLRTPDFANVQALNAALPGTALERADVVVASLGYTIGDLDK